jgi:hypothetical protein
MRILTGFNWIRGFSEGGNTISEPTEAGTLFAIE